MCDVFNVSFIFLPRQLFLSRGRQIKQIFYKGATEKPDLLQRKQTKIRIPGPIKPSPARSQKEPLS